MIPSGLYREALGLLACGELSTPEPQPSRRDPSAVCRRDPEANGKPESESWAKATGEKGAGSADRPAKTALRQRWAASKLSVEADVTLERPEVFFFFVEGGEGGARLE